MKNYPEGLACPRISSPNNANGFCLKLDDQFPRKRSGSTNKASMSSTPVVRWSLLLRYRLAVYKQYRLVSIASGAKDILNN
jgi:hypothetical protein